MVRNCLLNGWNGVRTTRPGRGGSVGDSSRIKSLSSPRMQFHPVNEINTRKLYSSPVFYSVINSEGEIGGDGPGDFNLVIIFVLEQVVRSRIEIRKSDAGVPLHLLLFFAPL